MAVDAGQGATPLAAHSFSDRDSRSRSGLGVLLAIVVGGVLGFIFVGMSSSTSIGQPGQGLLAFIGSVLMFVCFICLFGLYVVQPKASAVLQLFGSYRGTDRHVGLRWANPLMRVTRVSRRLRTHDIAQLKVNDAAGNPIEIGAAVIWEVADAARAVLEVEDYQSFVALQSETSLRRIAQTHPYDDHEPVDSAASDLAARSTATLRGDADLVIEELKQEISQRLQPAGLVVREARLTHLAYAPEIAGAMLRRQQASAIVAARRTIVAGAVGLVEDAIRLLKEKQLELPDDDRRAAMISNMLVVLVSDRDAVPVINAGSASS